MAKDEKIEERKKCNEPFLRVFDYLAKEKMMNQGQLAKVLDSESGYISLLRSGMKRVGDDYIARIAAAFAKHFNNEYHLNPDYIDGKSQYMIIENVPDEEVLAKIGRGANPDYDLIQRKNHANVPDMSSVFNSAIAAKDDAIESLKREIRTKDELLAEKNAHLAEKDERIAELKAHNIDLRRQLDQYWNSEIGRYTFPIGAADGEKRQTKRK